MYLNECNPYSEMNKQSEKERERVKKFVTKLDNGDHISIIRDMTWGTFIVIIVCPIMLDVLFLVKTF
jgi:hypothetical protein